MSVETPPMSATDKPVDSVNGSSDANESRFAEAAKKAEHIVRDSVETLRAQTRAYADTAAERLDTAQRIVVEHVRERPLSSTLTALGAGIVLGVLLAGRRR